MHNRDTFFNNYNIHLAKPIINETPEQRIIRVKQQLPSKRQSKRERNLSIERQRGPIITISYLKWVVRVSSIQDADIENYLNQFEKNQNKPISYLTLYNFIKILLKIVNYQLDEFIKHPIIRQLFIGIYFCKAIVKLHSISLLNRTNFKALYDLPSAQHAELCMLLEPEKNLQKGKLSLYQIDLLKQIIPYDRPRLHDLLEIISTRLQNTRPHIIALLPLSARQLKKLHYSIVKLLNNNDFTLNSYQTAYLRVFKELGKSLELLLSKKPFDMFTALAFVRTGINPHTCDINGNTLLHKCTENIIMNKKPEISMQILKELVEKYNANINVKNKSALSPWNLLLSYFDESFFPYILEFLELGANFREITAMQLRFLKYNQFDHPLAEKILYILDAQYNNLNFKNGINPCWHISSNSMNKLKLLGQGSFGKVYAGNWEGQPLAIKEIKMIQYDQFVKEAFILHDLRSLNSSNIIRFGGYDVDLNSRNCYIFMELAEKGDLEDLYFTEKPWELKLRYNLIYEIVSGITCIHSLGYMHNDIKSANVLITKQNHAKIGDFGLSKQCKDSTYAVGTSLYMAPEVLDSKPNSYKSDIFSLALTMCEVISWKFVLTLMSLPLSSTRVNIKAYYDAGFRPIVHYRCPSEIIKLITMGWSQNPENRPNAFQLEKDLKSFRIGLN